MADMSRKEIEELVADIGQGADIGVYDPSTGGWVGSMLDAERADDLLQNAYVALRQLLNAQKWREIGELAENSGPVLMGYDHGNYGLWIGTLNNTSFRKPTHFMPLPSPSQEKENGDV